MSTRAILATGALLGALAVATGAFGAHALEGVLSARAVGWYETAVTYHAGHALAIVACGLLSLQLHSEFENGHDVRDTRNDRHGAMGKDNDIDAAGSAGSEAVGDAGLDASLEVGREVGRRMNSDTGRDRGTSTISHGRPALRAVRFAALAYLLGIALFSGSLYAMAFTGITRLGIVTPFGGVALLVGWIALAVAAVRLPAALS